MTALTAQPTLYKTPGETLPIAASFKKELTSGDLLTGGVTADVSPIGPAVTPIGVNTTGMWFEIDGNRHYARPGQAVLLSLTGGTAGTTYQVKVTASSAGGRLFSARPINVVVSND